MDINEVDHDHDHDDNERTPYSISTIPQDIILTHILPHLDGVTLAAVTSSTRHLHPLYSSHGHDHLWRDLCHRTWPSTADPHLQQLISTFPSGHAMFYADSYPAIVHRRPRPPLSSTHPRRHPQPLLISAVDVQFGDETLFSGVEYTDTESKYFLYSEFLVSVLGPNSKERVEIPAESENWEEAEKSLAESLRLSWIVIDPESKRSGSVSTRKPVSVNRHWLTGEVELQYSTVFTAADGNDLAKCAVVVTCGGGEGKAGGKWEVREVSMKMEDVEGRMMRGRECMEILQDALERGERRGGGEKRMEEEEGKGYREYMGMVRRRKEKRERKDGCLDMAAAISSFLTISLVFFLCFLQFFLSAPK